MNPALQIRQPEITSPLTNIGQLMQIRDVGSQVALRQAQTVHAQQQAAEEQAKADQANRELKDQQLTQSLLSDPKNQLALSKGDTSWLAGKVSPIWEQTLKQKVAASAEQLALSRGHLLDNDVKANAELGKSFQGLNGLSTDDDVRQQYPGLISRLKAQGYLDHIDPAAVPTSITGKKDLEALETKLGLITNITEGALKLRDEQLKPQLTQAQIDEQKAVAAGHAVDTAQKQREQDAAALAAAAEQGPEALAAAKAKLGDRAAAFGDATNPKVIRMMGLDAKEAIQTGQKDVELARQASMQAETQRHNLQDESAARTRAGIEAGRLAVEKQRFGFESGGGISESAKMIAAGQMDPQTTRAILRTNQGLINQVRQIDPNFDEANIDKRFNTLKEFTNTSTGKAGGQALALNTLVHHADLYLKTAEALKNGTFRPGNAVYNSVAQAFGSAPPQDAAMVARFLAGETGKVATGGVPAEGEIKGILGNLSTSSSPDQIAGAAKTLLGIAAGRATPLMERVKDAGLENVVHVLGPDAQAILKQRGYNPSTMKPAAMIRVQIPGHAPGQIPADQKDAFLKEHPDGKVL